MRTKGGENKMSKSGLGEAPPAPASFDQSACADAFIRDGWVEVRDIQNGDAIVTATSIWEVHGSSGFAGCMPPRVEGTRVFRRSNKAISAAERADHGAVKRSEA